MPIYTVSWIVRVPTWASIEADTPQEAIQKAKDGEFFDVDSDHGARDMRTFKAVEGESPTARVSRGHPWPPPAPSSFTRTKSAPRCGEIDRLRAGKQKPAGKTVNVRIAVAVDEFKNWSAAGWNGAKDDEMKDGLFDAMEGVAVIHYVTAPLPVPEALEIEGGVSPATTGENATSGWRE